MVKNQKNRNAVLEELYKGDVVSDFGYTQYPTVLWNFQEEENLKPIEMNILLILISYCDKKNETNKISHGKLAQQLHVAPNTITNAIKRLKEKGLIEGQGQKKPWVVTLMCSVDGYRSRLLDFHKKKNVNYRIKGIRNDYFLKEKRPKPLF